MMKMLPFNIKVLYWLNFADVKVRHEGSCKNDLSDEEIVQKEEDPCQELQSVVTSQNGADKPLFCASDGMSYYSSKKYACAVKTNGDWFHCE